MSNGPALYGLNLWGEPIEPPKRGKIADSFTVPPFSVLNAREGFWQERRRAWLGQGIEGEMRTKVDSELGRTVAGANCTSGKNTCMLEGEGAVVSIFDPVLCELAYRWFCPPSGQILDPFAGGSVRGIVAALLGYRYFGVDLRPEQIECNQQQAAKICDGIKPEWVVGDSLNLDTLSPPLADFVFSCPPYGDLERYSDDPRDLSAQPHDAFLENYRTIIAKACGRLKPNRFACFVVGDFRDKQGNYRNFVGETISAFLAAGLRLYNEAILITAVGSLPIRIDKQFRSGRKLGKTHQNVLVFVKGDGKAAADACGSL